MRATKKISKKNAEQFDLIFPMLDTFLKEMKELSKKKQDGILNEFKVSKINKVLNKCLELLQDENSCEFLDGLDNDDLPSYSDVVLVLGQFRDALRLFAKARKDYDGDWRINS